MALNRDQITVKVLQSLEDVGVKFFSLIDVNASLQDAYDDICCYCGQLEKSVKVPFQANLVYYDFPTIIPDFECVVAIYNYNNNRWLIPSSTTEMDQFRWDWELWNGQPIYFGPTDFRYTFISPSLNSANGNMEVFYRAQADVMSDFSVPRIKSDYAKLLEFYAIGDLLESVKEYTKADIWLAQYFAGREKYKNDVKSLAQSDRIRMLEQNMMHSTL